MQQPGTISIKNVIVRRQQDNLAVVTYEEWQKSANGRSARLSTAMFQSTPAKPRPFTWLFVHETWLPESPP